MTSAIPDPMPRWTRPIRIPDAIEVTHAEPAYAIAGEKGTWRLRFVLSKEVPAGSALKLQLHGGRNNKPAFRNAQTERPDADGYLTVETDDGTRLETKPDEKGGTFTIALPAGGLAKGRRLTVVMGFSTGRLPRGLEARGERRLNKFFVLYYLPEAASEPQFPQWAGGSVWAAGTQDRIVAACTIHVLGGPTERIRAYAPASTGPGEDFAVLVRPEDAFGCLAHQRLGPIALSVDNKALDASVEPAAESTCVRATVRLPSEGTYRLTVREIDTGRQTVTNPTVCSGEPGRVYWGMIHGHTEMSDGTGSIDQYFHQLRNEVMLDFAAPGDHDHLWETSDELWRTTLEAVKRWHAPGEFVTFPGYEWAKWRKNGDGDRNVYYLDDDRPLYRSDDGEYPTPPDLFAALEGAREKAIVIPHHTGHSGNFCDWKDHSPAHERLVEIFQTRGSYECSAEDGNPLPERQPVPPFPGGYVRNALAQGWRVGFTAGGDDHSGHWGSEFRFGHYAQGLTSVETHERTREAIFDAMHRRRVVATTGARMLLTYHLAGNPMGSELSVKDHPGLAARRALSIEFHGTAPVDRVDVVRGNRVVHAEPGGGRMDMRLEWEDAEPIGQTWLPATPHCGHPFTFYYVRVVQTDGEVAWASPVWVDP